MRVSEKHRYAVATGRVEKAKSNNIHMMEQLSSQKKITALHHDPVGVGNVIKKRSKIRNIESYMRNVNFSKGLVEATESAVSGIGDRLQRARELAVLMANDTYDAESRKASGAELEQINQEIVQLANTTYNDRYVLSGFRSRTPALDNEGNYLGDDGALYLQIEEGKYRQINIPGRNLLAADKSERDKGHLNLLDSLNLLHNGLDTNSKHEIYRAIEELDFQIQKATSFQANVGAVWNALQNAEQRLEMDENQEKATLSRIEDADIYKASSNFKKTEGILQSTLMASNKLLQPSLLNFMQ